MVTDVVIPGEWRVLATDEYEPDGVLVLRQTVAMVWTVCRGGWVDVELPGGQRQLVPAEAVGAKATAAQAEAAGLELRAMAKRAADARRLA
jgi:hypothetical protein